MRLAHALVVRYESETELGLSRLLRPLLSSAAAYSRHPDRFYKSSAARTWVSVPVDGERDEEHQFGVTIPFRG